MTGADRLHADPVPYGSSVLTWRPASPTGYYAATPAASFFVFRVCPGCKAGRASVSLRIGNYWKALLSLTGASLSQFCWPVRVYYEDTDSGGVVYYANYLKFMERARTECLRAMGFEQDQLRQEEGILFTVHSVQADFKQPAKFNDALEVTAEISEQRRASLTFSQEIRRRGEPDLLCSGRVRIACVDAHSFKPVPIPEVVRSELTNVR
jgi:acyl-CoA thioester hydrolase